ncbi:MAG: hypothetical protein FLDDKLPJ_02305 [Phycisphaerae bacterium]|nr:hypothetical protein [Phycisphaerae bacterium]
MGFMAREVNKIVFLVEKRKSQVMDCGCLTGRHVDMAMLAEAYRFLDCPFLCAEAQRV